MLDYINHGAKEIMAMNLTADSCQRIYFNSLLYSTIKRAYLDRIFDSLTPEAK